MVETKKLSMAELKAKAEVVENAEMLQKVRGGDSDWCHGWWDQAMKSIMAGGPLMPH